MRRLEIRASFAADVRTLKKRREAIDWDTLQHVFSELIEGRDVPPLLNPHPMHSEWAGHTDFHLEGDQIVICKLAAKLADFKRIGSHTDLFKAGSKG